MDYTIIIFSVVGGLALFLYGMKILSEGLQMAFGDRLKELLEKITQNKLQALGVGAAVTAIIQSSSITTVTLVGLINAGIINLQQAVSVIMGANIGTTFTAQLIAFNVGKFALPIIALGVLINFVSKSDKWRYSGQIVMGFGILFLGMTLMSSEIKVLAKNECVVNGLATLGKSPILGIIAAAILTEILQSSSATSGMVISMGMSGLIDLQTAICLILGANVGTTITVVIAAFFSPDSALSAKRAAAAHVTFNILGVILFFPFIKSFTHLISLTSSDLPRQIANAHMLFNITVAALLLPLSVYLIQLVQLLIPGEEIRIEKGTRYLDNHLLDTPSFALAMAVKEASRMLDITLIMLNSCRRALLEKSTCEIKLIKENESLIDELDNKIELYLEKIPKEALSSKQQAQMAVLNHAISDIERIADHANNISELADLRISKKIQFSAQAFEELTQVFDRADLSVEKCKSIIGDDDPHTIQEILQIEKEVDQLVRDYEQNHLSRLEDGNCSPEAGPVYLDILRNLERITDHSHNIAYAKRFGF